jgi:hypothetical protein
MTRCPDCGERSPDAASFCITCGACLRPPAALPSVRIRGATGPTIRLTAAPAATAANAAARSQLSAEASLRQGLIAVVGLLFGALFVIGFAQLIAADGLSVVSLGPITVLVSGALLAERAWVNGDLWRGLRGMLLWGGLTWMLGTGGSVLWAALLALGWAALHPRWYSRHVQ